METILNSQISSCQKNQWNIPAIMLTLIALIHGETVFAINWTDVKSKAIVHAPTLKKAHMELDARHSDLDSANAAFYPKINSTISAQRIINQELSTSTNSYAAGISLDQSLFASGRDLHRVYAAIANIDSASASITLASVTLRAKLAKAWNLAIYQQKLAEITAKNIARRESNAQIVNLRYSGGRENKGSVLKTKASAISATVTAQEATSKAQLARGDLEILLGEELPQESPLTGTLLPTDEMINKIKSRNPNLISLRTAELKIAASTAAIKAAKAQYFPELSFFANVKKSASPDLPLDKPVYSAGLNLNVPIFDASTSTDVRAAAIRSSMASIELAEAKAKHTQDLNNAFSQLEFAVKKLDASKQNLEASKLQSEVSRQRYTLGLMSFQDWDSYESELIKSELDVLAAEKSVADAVATCHETLGVTLEEEP